MANSLVRPPRSHRALRAVLVVVVLTSALGVAHIGMLIAAIHREHLAFTRLAGKAETIESKEAEGVAYLLYETITGHRSTMVVAVYGMAAMSEADVDAIASLRHVEKLQLTDTGHLDARAVVLILNSCKRLTDIELPIDGTIAHELRESGPYERIETLSMVTTELAKDAVDDLAMAFPSTTHVRLQGGSNSGESVRSLGAFPELEELSIVKGSCSATVLDELLAAHPTVRTLRIYRAAAGITDEDLRVLALAHRGTTFWRVEKLPNGEKFHMITPPGGRSLIGPFNL